MCSEKIKIHYLEKKKIGFYFLGAHCTNVESCDCFQALYTAGSFDLHQGCVLESGAVLNQQITLCNFSSHSSICTSDIQSKILTVTQECSNIVENGLICTDACKNSVNDLSSTSGLAQCKETHDYRHETLALVNDATTICGDG